MNRNNEIEGEIIKLDYFYYLLEIMKLDSFFQYLLDIRKLDSVYYLLQIYKPSLFPLFIRNNKIQSLPPFLTTNNQHILHALKSI